MITCFINFNIGHFDTVRDRLAQCRSATEGQIELCRVVNVNMLCCDYIYLTLVSTIQRKKPVVWQWKG